MRILHGYEEITGFLGISLRELAAFLRVSSQFLGQMARSKRNTPIPIQRKLRELHQVILRYQAEPHPSPFDDAPAPSAEFLRNRLAEIDRELVRMEPKLTLARDAMQQRNQALAVFERMKTEMPGLDAGDLEWIRIQEDYLRHTDLTALTPLLWKRKVLLQEKQAVLEGLGGET